MVELFDLSDNNSVEELIRQIKKAADKKYDEAEKIVGNHPDSEGAKQWKFGYHTACVDIVRGLRKLECSERVV